MDEQRFHTSLDRIGVLLRDKLGVRGHTLEAQLGKAGRRLPRRLRKAVLVLRDAQAKAAHPKLARMIDGPRVMTACEDLETHLAQMDPGERRKTALLRWTGVLVFNLIVLGVLVAAFLRWQGGGG